MGRKIARGPQKTGQRRRPALPGRSGGWHAQEPADPVKKNSEGPSLMQLLSASTRLRCTRSLMPLTPGVTPSRPWFGDIESAAIFDELASPFTSAGAGANPLIQSAGFAAACCPLTSPIRLDRRRLRACSFYRSVTPVKRSPVGLAVVFQTLSECFTPRDFNPCSHAYASPAVDSSACPADPRAHAPCARTRPCGHAPPCGPSHRSARRPAPDPNAPTNPPAA